MANHCIVCGSDRSKFLFEKNGYSMRRCRSCGFEYADFKPHEEFTRDFYTDDFFRNGHQKYGYADYLAEKANIMKLNAKRVGFIEKYVKGGALLDVGCAAGFFLEALGPHWDLYGCEPSAGMASTARMTFGDRIVPQSFERYEPDRKFNVITLWDALEHLVDPAVCIRKVFSLLENDGYLFIGTPDTISPAAKILGRRWYHYIPPTHLHLFNRWNIFTFLRNNGFKVKRIVYFGRHMTLSELVLNIGFVLESSRLLKISERLLNAGQWNLSVPYRVFDEMFIMARKIHG